MGVLGQMGVADGGLQCAEVDLDGLFAHGIRIGFVEHRRALAAACIAETGKVLSEIRGTQVNIIKEKSNVLKTIADLEIRERNSKSQETDAGTNQFLMQNLLNEISRKVGDVSKPSMSEIRDNRGKEALDKLDPEALGMNDNDFAMIDKFKQASGK